MRVFEGTGEKEVAEAAGLSAPTAKKLTDGRLDTAVAACTDFEHSPFTPAGPCSVSFLLCFACPNALATSRHLPRIVYLYEVLGTLRSTVSAEVWSTDWAEHFARVSALLDDHTTELSRPLLLAELTERERALVDRMMERRLDP